MKVYNTIDRLPVFNKSVVTIGTFDGVHLGHLQIIAQLKKEAERIGGETVLVTFEPHPRKIVSSKPLQLLNTLSEKIELLEKQGVDNLVIVPFTPVFADQPANAYIEDFLVKRFHPHTVIIGYDHHFGKNRSGDFKLLEAYAERHAFELIEIPVHLVDQAAISSTKIREALLAGRVEEAGRFLGYDYFFDGRVMEGNKLGRTLGYPTANLQTQTEDKLIPGNGVYAVQAAITNTIEERSTAALPFNQARFKGMMNIGTRPTVDGSKRVIEVNLFDFNNDIYGQTVRVYVHRYLRKEQKFAGLDALKEQLARDREAAVAALA
jgi:riboflavin kinase/FMN adenylyltransferase